MIRDGKNNKELECGPMPNVMAALPNIGDALCPTPQSLADAHYCWLCGPAVEHRSLAGVLSLSCARLVADG